MFLFQLIKSHISQAYAPSHHPDTLVYRPQKTKIVIGLFHYTHSLNGKTFVITVTREHNRSELIILDCDPVY